MLKPGAGRNSGRGACFGSAPGRGCGGEGGAGRTFSGSGLFSRSSFNSDGIEDFALEQRLRDALERVAVVLQNVVRVLVALP